MFFILRNGSFELFVVQSVLDVDAVAFESIFGFNLFSDFIVLVFVFFSLFNESIDLFFGKSAFVVGDGDVRSFGSSFVSGIDVHDSVFVDFEADFNLRHSSFCGRNSIQIELS